MNREFQAKAKATANTIGNIPRSNSAPITHEISTSPQPPVLERTTLSLERTVSPPRLQRAHRFENTFRSIERDHISEDYCSDPTLHMHIETDIDSVEAEEIMHRKDPSTDSAVYMMDQVSHAKELSNESTDSIHELTKITDSTLPCMDDDLDFLPPPPDELLQDEAQEEEGFCPEKEKPQRTINRKKKDSYVVSSRNNSCVSTDSTTSTATADSGIVLRSDMSPRTSPLSRDQYYDSKDMTGSRETLDDDVADLNEEPDATSTPERYQQAKNAGYQLMRQDSMNSSGTNSRPDSMNLGSPKIEDLDNEKV